MTGQTKAVSPEPVEGRSLMKRLASTSSARTKIPSALRFAGYAAIFNRIDKGGDIIRPGAFASLTSAHPGPVEGSIPLLWQHNPDQRIGSVDYVHEDRRGLRVIGSISTATRAGRDAVAMLAGGANRGLSFGYRVKKSAGLKPRQLLDLDLAEISLVTHPMQGLARVHALR